MPFLQFGTAKKCAGMTKAISRDDSFYSGMAVSLTWQSCGLACPQLLILPLWNI